MPWSLRSVVAGLAVLLGSCSLAPFEPRIAGDDGGGRRDAAPADARVSERDGSMTGREGDCTNGSDDDRDGDIDCADSDCVDFTCVPDPPTGWMGPAYPSTTGCAAVSDQTLLAGGGRLRAAPVTCEACSCGGATNQRCAASISGRTLTGCGGSIVPVSVPGDGTCSTGSAVIASVANVTTNAVADCAVTSPSPPAVAVAPPHTFADSISLCWRGAGGGCGAGMRCVAPPPDGVPACVTREGDVACPAELPSRRILVTAVDDRRTCADCSCRDVGGSCEGPISAFSAATCSAITALGSVTPGTTCQELANARGFRYSGTASGVSCNAIGGNPEGCVAPAAVSTVCCPAASGPVCPSGPGPVMVHVPSSDGGFCIDSTEVTNAQYAAFLAASPDPSMQPAPCESDSTFEPNDEDWPPPADQDDHPVVGVDWCDARAYCEWAGKRLCSLTDGTTVGGQSDERDATRSEWTLACTAGGEVSPACDDTIQSVRSRPCCQVDGVYDLAGNAEEWTGTCDGIVWRDRCVIHRAQRCDGTDANDRTHDDQRLGFRCCADPA